MPCYHCPEYGGRGGLYCCGITSVIRTAPSSGQRGANETINALVCQYPSKRADQSVHNAVLEKIALELNMRTRKRVGV